MPNTSAFSFANFHSQKFPFYCNLIVGGTIHDGNEGIPFAHLPAHITSFFFDTPQYVLNPVDLKAFLRRGKQIITML